MEALGPGKTGGGGIFSVLALQPVRTLLAAGGAINLMQLRLIAKEGPQVIDVGNEKEGLTARILVMRCDEAA